MRSKGIWKKREDPDGHDDVVDQGRDGAHGEAPLEAHRHIDQHADERKQHGQPALLAQLLAHLGSHELDAPQLHLAVRGLAQGGEHPVADLHALRLVAEGGEADQDVLAGAEVLHGRPREPRGIERLGHGGEIGRVLVAHLDHCATGEIEAQVEASHHHRDQKEDEHHRRADGGHPPPLQVVEVYVLEDLKVCHGPVSLKPRDA